MALIRLADRMSRMEASGIRRIFDLAKSIPNPINLSIGQPHYDVPDFVKTAACNAIHAGKNAYTPTQGCPELRDALLAHYQGKVKPEELLVTSGVSGTLTLAFLSLLGPGDEVLMPDPYFVAYKQLAFLAGATPVYVDTYPTFQLDPDELEKKITPRTRAIIFSSPSNPCGVVYTEDVLKGIAAVAARHDLPILSDEIYANFCYDTPFQSISMYYDKVLVMGGFSKSLAMTGWRLAWATGPQELIQAMAKVQQFTFVCAPSMAQVAAAQALDTRMDAEIASYQEKRDRTYAALQEAGYEVEKPGGAFYLFPKTPWGTDMEFVEHAVSKRLLVVPGSALSERNTHFRISYATTDEKLDEGIAILQSLVRQ